MQDWLAARALASPRKIAFYQGDLGITFEELNQQVVQQTVALQSAHSSITKGVQVAVLGSTTLHSVSMMLALLRIGAVIVPLNNRLTVSEIIGQLRASGANFLVYDNSLYSETVREISLSDVKVLALLAYSEVCLTDVMVSATLRDFSLDEPLAIIHTSGTSGRPKGAVLTYGNFFYNAMASAYKLGHQADDVWLCALPLYHVGGLSIILRSILYGITVDLHEHFDVDAINQALDTRRITLISLVPTMLHRLLESRRSWPESLRLILLGGAAASPELLARCREIGLPAATTYGLTEAASQVATMLPEEVERKPGSVGKPLMFTRVRVVDEAGEPTAPGELGEIVVSGPTVMQGYYNDPEATERTLRSGELYTGDIGYLDEDGDLFVVQRRSDLIISGGENVYPAEVEAVLKQHPTVEEAVVVGVPDSEWGQQVAAAIVLGPGAYLHEDELLAFSRERLAGYKLPRYILFVDHLPLTSSGKVQPSKVIELFEDSV